MFYLITLTITSFHSVCNKSQRKTHKFDLLVYGKMCHIMCQWLKFGHTQPWQMYMFSHMFSTCILINGSRSFVMLNDLDIMWYSIYIWQTTSSFYISFKVCHCKSGKCCWKWNCVFVSVGNYMARKKEFLSFWKKKSFTSFCFEIKKSEWANTFNKVSHKV